MNHSILSSPRPELSSSGPLPSVAHARQARPQIESMVRIMYCSNPNPIVQVGHRVDIGDNGISFVTDAVLDFHRIMLLEYKDLDGKRCSRTARLRYRMNHTYGARFLGWDPTERPQ